MILSFKGKTPEERAAAFKEVCSKLHGKYDYSLIKTIEDPNENVAIICPSHGVFYRNTWNHYRNKTGCLKCLGRVLDTDSFVEVSKSKHGNRYDYSKSIFTGSKNKIEVICEIHGSFWQVAETHFTGHNCPKCANNNFSSPERKWLKSLNKPNLIYGYKIKINNKRYILDGYDPDTNTVYEFYGDFFHGNPKYYDEIMNNLKNRKSFGRLYSETLKKEIDIKGAGYNLITKWESDWKLENGLKFRKPITCEEMDYNRMLIRRIWELEYRE